MAFDLNNNPDFNIGPPRRRRFKTNTIGGMQGRAATISEQRQNVSKQDAVQMPVSPIGSRATSGAGSK
ncbi:hypothetical protein ONS96_011920 [Cadophora gregata f. sp. sojae]|nr:hypothetical protein ONS96_011920 [Cadophora gregata f. sp. sojae]